MSRATHRERITSSRPQGAAVLLASLLLYLVVCAVGQPGPDPIRDEPDLLAAAARLLHGQLVPAGVTHDPRAYLWHGPGLVAVLAPLVALHVPLQAMRFLGPLLLAGAVWGFHLLLRRGLGDRAARWWTCAFALYVPFLSVVPAVHKEPLASALVVAGLLALERGIAEGRTGPMVAAGTCLAGLTMVRLEYGWVTIALLALALGTWAARGRPAGAARLLAVPAVALALCLPWLATTYELTGKPLYWGTSSGLSLYWMSPTLAGQTGEWHSPDDVPRQAALRGYRPFFKRLSSLDPVRSDSVLRAHAVANVRAHPTRYARNLAANVGRLLFAAPARPRLSALRIAIDVLSNGALLAALGWAAILLLRRRVLAPPGTAPIAAFALLAVAVHLPASASPRMLLPVVPALLWLAARTSGPRARGDRRSSGPVGVSVSRRGGWSMWAGRRSRSRAWP